jgi:16S rRNA (cytosine967-C5)-methyltransferase
MVLLDAPCTALGVLAENPDARWRKGESQIAKLAAEQCELLKAAAAWVKPGGRLVYSVCTLSLEETVQQRDAFLERFPEFRLEKIRREEPGGEHVGPEGDLFLWPDRTGGSGMYAVRFRRMDP